MKFDFQGEKYMGDRSRRQLLKFALKMVQADVHEIQTEGQIEDNGLPWLITFCGDSGGKLSPFIFILVYFFEI